jgi:phage shock protein PspC (stress-responsive transcriptional regulator)
MNSTPPQPLTRSTTDNVVRAGWIFSTVITGGAAIIAYVAMLVIVPTDDAVPTHAATA